MAIADPIPSGSLAAIVGAIDIPAAFMLVALFVTICIVVTTMIVKRRSNLEMNNEFALAKIRLADAQTLAIDDAAKKHEQKLASQSANFRLEEQKIERGLLTSHTKDVTPAQNHSYD